MFNIHLGSSAIHSYFSGVHVYLLSFFITYWKEVVIDGKEKEVSENIRFMCKSINDISFLVTTAFLNINMLIHK